jgi:hypothetical protein
VDLPPTLPVVDLPPTLPVVDAVGTAGYGRIRLWGAVSFGICSLIGGASIDQEGAAGGGGNAGGDVTAFRWLLFGAAALGVLAAAVLSGVSVVAMQRQMQQQKDKTGTDGKNEQLRRLGGVFCTSRMGVFLCVVFCSGLASGFIDTFLYVHLAELGASGTLMGMARFITCAAEVPFFRVSAVLIDRLGVFGVLAVAQLAYVVRQLWYASLDRATLWWVLPCEVLHGLTFAALWSACCYFGAAMAPPGLKASMQGVVGGVHWGLGQGTGMVLGGVLFGSFGGVSTRAHASAMNSWHCVYSNTSH